MEITAWELLIGAGTLKSFSRERMNVGQMRMERMHRVGNVMVGTRTFQSNEIASAIRARVRRLE